MVTVQPLHGWARLAGVWIAIKAMLLPLQPCIGSIRLKLSPRKRS